MYIKPRFSLACFGTSLTTGRLSADWVPRLSEQLQQQPEAVGPIDIYNLGKGGETSVWGLANAHTVAALRPTHILSEGFGINDSALGVSQPDHISNIEDMVAMWRAARADVDITFQTMSSVDAAVAVGRPNLAAYYADTIATALALDCRVLDNYGGGEGLPVPPGIAGGWPKPLPTALTNANDGLHPIWTGAVGAYLFPNVLFHCRVLMAEYWGLAPPNPPEPSPPLEIFYEIVAGGGGGGGSLGGGGGAGEIVRGEAVISDLIDHAVVVGNGGAGGIEAADKPGTNGVNSSFFGAAALGGGGGGGYVGSSQRNGKDGGSGGGAASHIGTAPGGLALGGFGGHAGGDAAPGVNVGSGGGGGGSTAGEAGTNVKGGDGGIGQFSNAPLGFAQRLAPGGYGGAYTGTKGAYPAGYAWADYGAGGWGGGLGGGTGSPGQEGRKGVVFIWYDGPQRATGGDLIISFAGQTCHFYENSGNFTLLA